MYPFLDLCNGPLFDHSLGAPYEVTIQLRSTTVILHSKNFVVILRVPGRAEIVLCVGSQVSTGAKRNRADDAASQRRFDSVTSSKHTTNFALSAEVQLQLSNELTAKTLVSPPLTVVYVVLMDFRDYENY